MENRNRGGFLKGLLIFGVGAAVGYLAARKLNISLHDENEEWDCCEDCCEDSCDCCKLDDEAAGEEKKPEPDEEDLAF